MKPEIENLLALLDDEDQLLAHLDDVLHRINAGSDLPALALPLRDEVMKEKTGFWRFEKGRAAVAKHSGWNDWNMDEFFCVKAQPKHWIVAALIAKALKEQA